MEGWIQHLKSWSTLLIQMQNHIHNETMHKCEYIHTQKSVQVAISNWSEYTAEFRAPFFAIVNSGLIPGITSGL